MHLALVLRLSLGARLLHKSKLGAHRVHLRLPAEGREVLVVRDSAGDVIEGDANAIKRQKDVWTFARVMGASDPNWKLVATEAEG